MFTKKSFLKLFLVLLLCASFVCIASYNEIVTCNANDFAVRTIDTDEIGQLSYSEKAEDLINEFDTYESVCTDTSLSFSGDILLAASSFTGFETLSTGNEEIKKSYATNYNFETNEFVLKVTYSSGEQIIDTLEEVVEPIYDEVNDDVYFYYEGNKVSVSELLKTDNVNDCVAIVDDAIIVGGVAISAAAVAAIVAGSLVVSVVAADPTIVTKTITTVKTVVKTVSKVVVEKVTSVWRWFKRTVLKKKTVTSTVTSTVTTTSTIAITTPSITVNGTKIKTKELTNAKSELKALPANVYYLMFADPGDGKIYLSVSPITAEVAVSIMNIPIIVPRISNKNRDMIASVYTYKRVNAEGVTAIVGFSSRTPKGYPENHSPEKGYLPHYHSISEVNGQTPHAFFGLPGERR